jgi:uncharacterized protein YbaP (TraB family)
MNHFRWLLLPAALALAACATIREQAGKDVLWRVRTGHSTLYLLGSVHVLPRNAYPLRPALEHAFTSSERLVFEINIASVTKNSLRAEATRAGVYPAGQSLSKSVSPQTVLLLRSVLPQFGLTLKQVNRLRPSFLAQLLETRILAQAGYSPDYGVDLYFYRRAVLAQKPVMGLETLRDQTNLFHELTPSQDEQYLIRTIHALPYYPTLVGAMVDAWRNGDIAQLDRFINQGLKVNPWEHQTLLVSRNSKWLPQIEHFAQERHNYLVVVGAGHLIGNEGLVAQLKRAGYSVEQL